MSDHDETYDQARVRALEGLLLRLAERIQALAAEGRLLVEAGELIKLVGDVKSELFHYEVRATYDTPEVAENRRIVEDATRAADPRWERRNWTPDDEDAQEW